MKTIIYLHGFATLGGFQNRKSQFLKTQFDQVESVSFDCIDFNPTPKDFEFHTISGMIDRLRQTILLNQLEPVYLVGNSQGADVALNYAARYGGVEKLLLIAPELFYDSYISDEELAEWEEIVSAPIFHYGFQKDIPLNIAHHHDGLRYVTSPEPPCPILLIHGQNDSDVPIERSRNYAKAYLERVQLIEVNDNHSLRNQMPFIWENIQSFFDLIQLKL